MKIKVRGIYSTAIVKFLIDNGYDISEPSIKQKERFGLEQKEGFDVYIFTPKNDLNKIIITGSYSKDLIESFRKNLWDSLFIEKKNKDVIKANIIEIDHENKIVKLKLNGEDGYAKINDQDLKWINNKKYLLVTILNRIGDKYLCRIVTKIEGKYIVAYRNGYNKISENLNESIRKEIENLLQTVHINGWGIFVKPNVNNITELLEELQRFKEKLENEENPSSIQTIEIELGYYSKKYLDELRSKVIKTIQNHHIYRSSSEMTKIVDFIELSDINKELYISAIKRYIIERIKEKGTIRKIHVNGEKRIEQELTVNKIDLFDDRIYLELFKIINWRGNYDGLNIPAEEGDYKIEYILENLPFFIIEYYSKEHELKGRYININSPIEILPENIRYIDFEVDIVQKGKEMRVVDEDLLNDGINKGIYSSKVKEYVGKIVSFLTNIEFPEKKDPDFILRVYKLFLEKEE